MRRTPELMQFDSAKSMIRNFPPKNTAGLARRSVSCFSLLPRPPASTRAMDRCASLCCMRVLDSISATLFRRALDCPETVRERVAGVNVNRAAEDKYRNFWEPHGCRGASWHPRQGILGLRLSSDELAGDFAKCPKFGLQHVFEALEAAQLDEQVVALGARGPRNLLAQARQVALNGLQLRFDRTPVELKIGRAHV